MKSNYKKIFFLFSCLLLSSICYATFVVYLKDGTVREVTKIEFKGQHAELYLTTGKVIRLRKDSIDFRMTGMEPPTENKVTVHGTKSSDKIIAQPEVQRTGPSQEELLRQWNGTGQSAVALRDTGSVSKGDTVRIVGTGSLGHTIIARMPDGSYKRIVINSEIFAENFEITKAPRKKIVPPADLMDNPVEPAPSTPSQTHKPRLHSVDSTPRSKPSLIWPVLISIGLLGIGIGSSILLSKTDPATKKKGIRR